VTSGGDLPSEFPDDFPIFKDAKLTGTVTGEQEGQSGFFATWETDASPEDVTAFYKGALDKDPWKTSGTFTSGGGSVITFARTDGKDLGGGVTVSSDGKTQVVAFLGQGTGLAPTAEATQEEQPTPTPKKGATATNGEPTAQTQLPDEVALPKGYPADVAPIPDGARLTEASSFTSGGTTSFALKYLTQEAPQSIADFYAGKVPGNGWSEATQGSTGGQIFASYQNEAAGGNLVLSIAPSDTYEGYTEVDVILSTGQ